MISIGEKIAKLRKKALSNKGTPISQMELSLKIGWENPSTLSRIESGEVKPTRETIIKIGQALDLTENDINILLKDEGLVPSEKELTTEYIESVVENLDNDFKRYKYPVFSHLSNGDILYWNQFTDLLFIKGNDILEERRGNLIEFSFVELVFDPKYNIHQNIVNFDEVGKTIIRNMNTTINLSLQIDPSFNKNFERWTKIDNFRTLWISVSKKTIDRYQLFNFPFIYNHPNIGRIDFTINSSHLYKDNRFVIQQLIPSENKDNKKLLLLK